MQSGLKVKAWKSSALPPSWFKRQTTDEKNAEQVESEVKAIINQVVKNGDAALKELTEKFDKARLDANDFRVTQREVEDAYNEVSQEQVAALQFMKNRVSAFEELTLKQAGFKTSKEGITVQTVLRPIGSVGCYVPGGQAAYPSTLVIRRTNYRA